jgi:hypothetical protein
VRAAGADRVGGGGGVSSARVVVEAVLDELRNRKGFDWWWDDLDEDIQVEIVEACVQRVERRTGMAT